MIPVLLSERFSASVPPPRASWRAAPPTLVTVVLPAVVPSAPALEMRRAPATMVIGPVMALGIPIAKVPLSAFWNPFTAPKVPPSVRVSPPTTSRMLLVLAPFKKLKVRAVVKLEVARKVAGPALRVTALVPVPSTASLATATPPPVMLTKPLKVLAPVRVTTPVPVLLKAFAPLRTPPRVRPWTTLEPVRPLATLKAFPEARAMLSLSRRPYPLLAVTVRPLVRVPKVSVRLLSRTFLLAAWLKR